MGSGLRYPLSEVKKTVDKWLYLEDDRVIDIVAGAYIANQLTIDPIWLILIGPPSSAKTEILRATGQDPNVELISAFTKATLVSGVIPKGKLKEPSLLYKLNDKVLVIKEFSSILSMKDEAKAEVIAQLREAYDGSYQKVFGNGKVVDWVGRFGLLAACTPAYDKHHAIIGSLGDRFLLYRHHNSDPMKMGMKAMACAGKEEQMRTELTGIFTEYLKQFHSLENMSVTCSHYDEKMVALSVMASYGRAAVDRDRYSQVVEYIPEIEGPPRLSKQLKSLAAGIALAQGKTEMDEGIYGIIKKVACDVMPVKRFRILEHLWGVGAVEFLKGWQKTKEVIEGIKIPSMTTRLALEDLQIVGILNQELTDDIDVDEKDRKGRKPYKWQISDKGYECINVGQVFNNGRQPGEDDDIPEQGVTFG